jgi:hypothetical protein
VKVALEGAVKGSSGEDIDEIAEAIPGRGALARTAMGLAGRRVQGGIACGARFVRERGVQWGLRGGVPDRRYSILGRRKCVPMTREGRCGGGRGEGGALPSEHLRRGAPVSRRRGEGDRLVARLVHSVESCGAAARGAELQRRAWRASRL